eukprot:3702000-Rhodomonas_salina.1
MPPHQYVLLLLLLVPRFPRCRRTTRVLPASSGSERKTHYVPNFSRQSSVAKIAHPRRDLCES